MSQFFNRLFRKSYSKLQSNTQSTLREFYEEAIYFLHQPNSIYIRFIAISAVIYWFSVTMYNYQMYLGSVYKRKKIRLMELNNQEKPLPSREEEEIFENYRKISMTR